MCAVGKIKSDMTGPYHFDFVQNSTKSHYNPFRRVLRIYYKFTIRLWIDMSSGDLGMMPFVRM